MKQGPSSLFRNIRGTSAIELALIAPTLCFMVMGIGDISRALARKFEIDQAAYRAVEMTAVGNIQTDYTQFIKDEAVLASKEPPGHVQVVNWRECNRIERTPFADPCPPGEEIARFVRVDIFSDFKPMFEYGPFGEAFGADKSGKIRLRTNVTVRVQ